MSEPPISRADQWRGRMRRVSAPARLVLIFASGVLAAFAALLLYNAAVPGPHQITPSEVNQTVAQALASTTPLPPYSEQVYQVIQPSLVLIQAQSPAANGKTEYGLGSGVIINDQGDIMTSLHVVTQSTQIELTFADGTKSAADVKSSQPEQDIAVLHAQTPPAKIVAATLGNPGASRVGDEAFAVGNPFGLYGSMSAGVISGFDRSIQPVNTNQTLKNLIQIDAAVNPGNSGGPLLNRYGEVIGIVTGLANPTDQNFFVGVGFATPINSTGPSTGVPPW